VKTVSYQNRPINSDTKPAKSRPIPPRTNSAPTSERARFVRSPQTLHGGRARRAHPKRPAFMMVLRRENPLDRVKWAASRRPRLAFWRAREETNQTMPYRVKATAVEGGFKT